MYALSSSMPNYSFSYAYRLILNMAWQGQWMGRGVGLGNPTFLRKNDGWSYVIQWDPSARYEPEMNKKIRPTSVIMDWPSGVSSEVLRCEILILVLPVSYDWSYGHVSTFCKHLNFQKIALVIREVTWTHYLFVLIE